jgi:D,D-heptose 1,7-bisphosphate phosphatase
MMFGQRSSSRAPRPEALAEPPAYRRAVFLDRDGTLTLDKGYTYRVEDFRLLDNVVEGLALLRSLGFKLVVVTNQSGIARGMYTEADMQRYNDCLFAALAEHGLEIAGLYHCPYHPDGIGGYRGDSELRKPAPGMFFQAAREHRLDLSRCFAIGDKKSDIVAGRAAGCRTFLVKTGMAGQGEPDLVAEPDWVVADLLEAARIIERVR